jgi:hypothetical protein
VRGADNADGVTRRRVRKWSGVNKWLLKMKERQDMRQILRLMIKKIDNEEN